MATECSQEAILSFLKEKGGRVKTTDLVEHFRAVFPEEPERKAAVRDTFKAFVGNVALVKAESGVKYVCLRKRFRENNGASSSGTEDTAVSRHPPRSDSCDVQPSPGEMHHPPGSGYGNDSQVRVPHGFPLTPTSSPDNRHHGLGSHEFVCVVEEEVSRASGEMGNRGSFRRKKSECRDEPPNIPEITVIEASPLPADGSAFSLPELPHARVQTGPAGLQVDECTPVETDTLSPEEQFCGTPSGPQHRPPDSDEDDGRSDSHSLSGSESNTSPSASRKHFIQVMMNSSPQVRRSMVMRGSIYLSSKSDSDSASLASSIPDPDLDAASVALEPIEHEWMLCASDGEWASLYRLLATEPSLLLRKDFVTGFTCLHWAAKHGKPELIALIINFAKQHHIPISVDVRSNSGYTPLHIAAMHNHMEVVKLLVGAYNADVEIRDYSGKKACQYLTDKVSVDIRDIIGQYELSEAENRERKDGGRWRFSKVIQANLKPLRLLNNDADSVDGEGRHREKPVRRKSSLSRMKPKLQRLRVRTSQIVHGVTFHDTEELEKSGRGSFKSRPKTHFFG